VIALLTVRSSVEVLPTVQSALQQPCHDPSRAGPNEEWRAA